MATGARVSAASPPQRRQFSSIFSQRFCSLRVRNGVLKVWPWKKRGTEWDTLEGFAIDTKQRVNGHVFFFFSFLPPLTCTVNGLWAIEQ